MRDSPIGAALCETTVLKDEKTRVQYTYSTHLRGAIPCGNWFGSCGAVRLAWLLPALPPAPAGQSPPRSREVATGCRSRRGASNVVSLEHPRRGRTRGAAGEDTGDLGFGTPPNRSRRLPRPQVARVTAPTLHRRGFQRAIVGQPGERTMRCSLPSGSAVCVTLLPGAEALSHVVLYMLEPAM